jgi:hypothetical protein
MVPALTVELVGGLGNQLFQLAALLHIARKTRRTPYLTTLANPSPHSSVSYFDTIFYRFRSMLMATTEPVRISETSWQNTIRFHSNVQLTGYFQDWRYVTQEFIDLLLLPPGAVERNPGVHEGIFLHIRGGDYVGNTYHDVGLDDYYARAIAMFPGAHFFLVTNDLNYAMNKPYLKDLKYTVVLEPELETLYLMSQCAGGICANSSFSWWGAFLNPHRKIVMPDRWFPHNAVPTEGYYFPGVIKCPV